MKEIWKDIVGYEGLYQVSNLGKVKSLDRVCHNPRYGKQKRRGNIMRPSPNNYGYLQVRLSKLGKSKTHKVHRLVALAFLTENRLKKEVNHKDGNKENNCFSNLEWVNRSENVKHAFDIGIKPKPRGEKNGGSRLTESQVLKIRNEYDGFRGGVSMDFLADKYNVGRTTIARIIHRKTWKHI